eukprot:c15929_g1_i3 orf=25-222(+)
MQVGKHLVPSVHFCIFLVCYGFIGVGDNYIDGVLGALAHVTTILLLGSAIIYAGFLLLTQVLSLK